MTIATVLYLDHAPIWGGAEAVLVNLLEHLDNTRFRPLVATTAGSPLVGPLDARAIEWTPVTFGPLNRAGVSLPFNLAQAVWQVMWTVRRRQVALIHSNTVRTHIIGALAATLTRTPLIWTLHDNTFPPALVRICAPAPSRVITVSDWLRRLYSPFNLGHKMEIVHNGIGLAGSVGSDAGIREELGIPLDVPLVISVGRLIPGKAPHLFVEAARSVLNLVPDAHFVLVGGADPAEAGRTPSSYASNLAPMVRRYGLEGHFRLAGHRANVERFYAAADLVVYCATQPEGWPTVLLEAMAHAKPVVASAIGGAAEIVQDKLTGLLVPPADPAALSTAVAWLLHHPEHACALGQAGQTRLRREFSIENQVTQTTRIYADVLALPG
jgi:glycosyltransferase involved in cell wall biosynthesis